MIAVAVGEEFLAPSTPFWVEAKDTKGYERYGSRCLQTPQRTPRPGAAGDTRFQTPCQPPQTPLDKLLPALSGEPRHQGWSHVTSASGCLPTARCCKACSTAGQHIIRHRTDCSSVRHHATLSLACRAGGASTAQAANSDALQPATPETPAASNRLDGAAKVRAVLASPFFRQTPVSGMRPLHRREGALNGSSLEIQPQALFS